MESAVMRLERVELPPGWSALGAGMRRWGGRGTYDRVRIVASGVAARARCNRIPRAVPSAAMRTRTLGRGACAVLLVASVAGAWAAEGGPSLVAKNVKGEVIRHEGASQSSVGERGAIDPGQIVETHAASGLHLDFLGAIDLTLGPGAALMYHSAEARQLRIKLGSGDFEATVAPDADLRFNVGPLRARAMGARVAGRVRAEGATICVLQGKVDIQTPAGEKELNQSGQCLDRAGTKELVRGPGSTAESLLPPEPPPSTVGASALPPPPPAAMSSPSQASTPMPPPLPMGPASIPPVASGSAAADSTPATSTPARIPIPIRKEGAPPPVAAAPPSAPAPALAPIPAPEHAASPALDTAPHGATTVAIDQKPVDASPPPPPPAPAPPPATAPGGEKTVAVNPKPVVASPPPAPVPPPAIAPGGEKTVAMNPKPVDASPPPAPVPPSATVPSGEKTAAVLPKPVDAAPPSPAAPPPAPASERAPVPAAPIAEAPKDLTPPPTAPHGEKSVAMNPTPVDATPPPSLSASAPATPSAPTKPASTSTAAPTSAPAATPAPAAPAATPAPASATATATATTPSPPAAGATPAKPPEAAKPAAPAPKPSTAKALDVPPNTAGWTVVIAALASQDGAKKEAARLKETGLPADVFAFEKDGTTMYRIGLGHFRTYEAATKYVAHVKKAMPEATPWVSTYGTPPAN